LKYEKQLKPGQMKMTDTVLILSLKGRTPLATPDVGMEYSGAPKEGQAMTSLD
jgi:hypothetical protein